MSLKQTDNRGDSSNEYVERLLQLSMVAIWAAFTFLIGFAAMGGDDPKTIAGVYTDVKSDVSARYADLKQIETYTLTKM